MTFSLIQSFATYLVDRVIIKIKKVRQTSRLRQRKFPFELLKWIDISVYMSWCQKQSRIISLELELNRWWPVKSYS